MPLYQDATGGLYHSDREDLPDLAFSGGGVGPVGKHPGYFALRVEPAVVPALARLSWVAFGANAALATAGLVLLATGGADRLPLVTGAALALALLFWAVRGALGRRAVPDGPITLVPGQAEALLLPGSPFGWFPLAVLPAVPGTLVPWLAPDLPGWGVAAVAALLLAAYGGAVLAGHRQARRRVGGHEARVALSS